MRDAHNRIINYLRISVTDRCNLRCKYCMPGSGVDKKEHSDILSFSELSAVAKTFISQGINKIRLTGGEPLVRKGIVHLVNELGGEPELKDLAMTTNGILLAPLAKTLKQSGLKRVNISLDTVNPLLYSQITRGGDLGDVLKGIDAAKNAGLTPLKINSVLIGGVNDGDIKNLIALADNKTVDEIRFIELMPIGETAGWDKSHFLSNDFIINRFELEPLCETNTGPAKRYITPRGGVIGLISPISHRFCNECNRIRLTADGKIKPCLLSNEEVDIKDSVRGDLEELDSIIKHIIESKPKEYNLNTEIKRNMVNTGG